MQIVGGNLHEMSNSIVWGKREKYFKISSAEIITQHTMCEVSDFSTYMNSEYPG